MNLASLDLDGVSFEYCAAGEGAPVILLHGAPSDCRMWAPHCAALAAHYRVIASALLAAIERPLEQRRIHLENAHVMPRLLLSQAPPPTISCAQAVLRTFLRARERP